MALTPAQKLAAAVAAVSDPHNGSSPYFGPVLRGLVRREVERDSSLRTLAVSAQGVLYWQPAFIEKHSIEDLRWALEHETMHVILKHADRRDAIGADPKLFNWAADACINDDLREGGRPIASWAIFPETLGQPKGLTAEERYRRLRDDAQAQQQAASQIGSGQGNNDACDNPQSGGGGGGGGGQDDSGDGGPQQGDGQDGATDETGQEGGGVGAGNCGSCAGRKGSWEDAERDNKEGRTEAEIEGMRRETAEAIREHGKREGGTGRGTIPGNLARWADDFLKPPKVDWRQHLQQAVREGVAYKRGMVDTYYGGVSRRQAGIGFGPGRPILPVFRAPIPRVACIVDTSGSMGSDELMDAVSETSGVLQAVGLLSLVTPVSRASRLSRIRSRSLRCLKAVVAHAWSPLLPPAPN